MTIQKQLIDKSKEAFVLAIEIYNKPRLSTDEKNLAFLFVMHGN